MCFVEGGGAVEGDVVCAGLEARDFFCAEAAQPDARDGGVEERGELVGGTGGRVDEGPVDGVGGGFFVDDGVGGGGTLWRVEGRCC